MSSNSKQSKSTDSCIVAFDCTNGKDNTVLIVGKKKEGMDVDIINAFQGEEAIELWSKLTTQKGASDETE